MYIYIFERNLEKNSLFENGGQNNFCHMAQ